MYCYCILLIYSTVLYAVWNTFLFILSGPVTAWNNRKLNYCT